MGVGARGVGGCQAPAAVLLKYGETTHEVSEVAFMDTGLACYLTAWLDGETLRRGAAAGHMFETFVVRGTQELPERRGRCAGRELLPH